MKPSVPLTLLFCASLTAVGLSQRASSHGALNPELLEVLKHLSLVQLDDGLGGKVPTLRIEGLNVQIVNGLGATNGNPSAPYDTGPGTATNGAGNLILGYGEPRPGSPVDRSGSHCLIVGPGHGYSSFGGLVVGSTNSAGAPYASVYAGVRNESLGLGATVTAGQSNRAAGVFSTVSAGFGNWATGDFSAVSGGTRSLASGPYASVSGGYKSRSTGEGSSVGGGDRCEANGRRASVCGGSTRRADGGEDWAAGSLLEDF